MNEICDDGEKKTTTALEKHPNNEQSFVELCRESMGGSEMVLNLFQVINLQTKERRGDKNENSTRKRE